MNRGAEATIAAIRAGNITQNQAAAELECDSGYLSKILRELGGQKPGRALSLRIQKRFGVSPKLWDQPSRQKGRAA